MTLYYCYYFGTIDSIVKPSGSELLFFLFILYFTRLLYYIFFELPKEEDPRLRWMTF